MNFKSLIFVFIILVFNQTLFSQDLINSPLRPSKGYIYKLSDEQIKTFYLSKDKKFNDDFLTNRIDSFLVDSIFKKKLEPGFYIKQTVSGNLSYYDFTYIPKYQVYILNNVTDLVIAIYDKNGNQITDANITIKNRKLKFDKKTNLYKLKKSNKKGLLEIEYKGKTSYYFINRNRNNSLFSRIISPLNYVWYPIKAVIWNPSKYFRSWYWSNKYYRIVNKFTNLFPLFEYESYLITNKSMYRPNDTVKLKAFITNSKGQKVKRKLYLKIIEGNYYGSSYTKKICELKPDKTTGNYLYSFVLKDSLELKLDKTYRLEFQNKRGKTFAENSFKYEDYDLKTTILNVRIPKNNHFNNKEFSIFVKATDFNGLNLPDAKVKVSIYVDHINKVYQDIMFCKKLLWEYYPEVENLGETKIIIPDSIFPKANLNYKININLKTADNEWRNKHFNINRYYKNSRIIKKFNEDSIEFKYQFNGKETTNKFYLIEKNANSNTNFKYLIANYKTKGKLVSLPLKLKIDQQVSKYYFINDSLKISISPPNPNINITGNRTKNNISLSVQNKQNLLFSYYIYRGNTLIKKGNDKKLKFERKDKSNKVYTVFLYYIWNGEMKKISRQLNPPKKNMKINVIQPDIIYPGQKVDFTIKLTNYKNKAIKNADISAFGMKTALNNQFPSLPNYKIKYKTKGKKYYNEFNLKKVDNTISKRLDYDKWHKLFNLDTIEYYKFLYPNSVYLNYQKIDKNQIEIAPFVVINGNIKPISYILYAGKPIYFSWTYYQPYSFVLPDTGKNVLNIRLKDTLLRLTNIPIKKGYKLIIAINPKQKNKYLKKIVKKPSNYTDKENYLFQLYTLRYNDNFNGFAYIKENEKIYLLSTPNDKNPTRLTGPLFNDSILVHYPDNFQKKYPFLKNWNYIFEKDLLKLTKNCNSGKYPYYTKSGNTVPNLTDRPINKKRLDKIILNYKLSFRQKNLTNNLHNDKISNTFFNLIQTKSSKLPLNLILYNSNFCYNFNNTFSFSHYISPGKYNLILLYKEGNFQVYNNLEIKNVAYNFYNLKVDSIYFQNKASIKLDSILTNTAVKHNSYWLINKHKQILNKISKDSLNNKIQINNDKFVIKGTQALIGNTISGYVRYADDNSPLPGVSVLVQGTNIATVTDMDGFYSISGVPQFSKLEFSLMGMETFTTLANNNVINAFLENQNVEISAVVVTALGVARNYKKSEDYTVNALAGKVAGVNVINNIFKVDSNIKLKNIYELKNDKSNKQNQFGTEDILKTEFIPKEKAVPIYGKIAQNGAWLLYLIDGRIIPYFDINANEQNNQLVQDSLMKSSLRTNFKDYSFWKPSLKSDKNGEVKFSVKFPDDITKWQNFFIGISKNNLVATKKTNLKSYKPIMAQVALPRFIIRGDIVKSIGKISNYTYDSISFNSKFFINDSLQWQKSKKIDFSDIDTLEFTSDKSSDSMKIKYIIEKDDGYFDGEERKIPVLPVGIELAKGNFFVLNKDTSITISNNDLKGQIEITAFADVLDFIIYETKKVYNYKYYCNEQLSSKLIALLIEKDLLTFKGQKFKKDREVKKIIKMLKKRRSSDGLWGWWGNSKYQLWITLRVTESLIKAKKHGYNVNIDMSEVGGKLLWYYDKSNISDKIRILKILKSFNYLDIDYKEYSNDLMSKAKSFDDSLALIQVQQNIGLKPDIDFIWKNSRTTMYGNIYFTNPLRNVQKVYNTNIILTTNIYKILKKNGTSDDTLNKISNYFFEMRQNSYGWRNTYETVKIIETLIPDFSKYNNSKWYPEIEITGDINKTITKFPYKEKINLTNNLTIDKKGKFPVYFSIYKRYWVKDAKENSEYFEVKTSFPFGDVLFGGEKTIMNIKINVKKECEYVMVNVPIPAGCSYYKKPNSYWSTDQHCEYYKNKMTIFYEKMYPGIYSVKIDLMPRYSGKYTLNPAKAELMYFPIFYGNNEMRKVDIK